MVGMSASADLPLHHKVHKFSHGTGSPGWSQKKGRKMVVVRCGEFQCLVTSGYPDGSAQGAEVKIAWKLLNNNSHPAVVEQDCPEINSSQRWCLCKNAHVVWSHGDLGGWAAAGLLSQARRRTTSCGNGCLRRWEGMSSATGVRFLYCEMERPGNLPSHLPKQHYGRCRHKGKHSGSDVARLNKVHVRCRETRAGSKNQLLDKQWWRNQRYCHRVTPNSCKCAPSTE